MPTRMLINGNPSNIAIANTKLLRKALKDYKAENVTGMGANPTLEELKDNIIEANADSNAKAPGMSGLSGILGRVFLEAADKAISSGDNYDRQRRVEISLRGQIKKYAYNKADQSGSITSITYIDRTIIPAGNNDPIVKTEAFKWEVTVEAGGFEEVFIGKKPLTDPFPGTLEFSPFMIDRIESLGFEYKLWAKGNKIRIDKVSKAININNDLWKELKKTNPKYAKLYERNDDNCIDMMFVEEPPADLMDMGPPMYCLGRCGNPMLVNTGM